MSKGVTLYIIHIIEATEKIESYVKDCSIKNVRNETMRWDAILRNLQTITESTKHLPVEIKSKYPQIPWHKIAGLRNILVHDYLGDLNEQALWNTITVDLIELKQAMLKLLPDWKVMKAKN